jgi:hypothetical protein
MWGPKGVTSFFLNSKRKVFFKGMFFEKLRCRANGTDFGWSIILGSFPCADANRGWRE